MTEEEIAKKNKYRDRIMTRLDSQQVKGWHKYPMPLCEDKKIPMRERLEHLAQELTDGLMYIEHIIDGLDDLESMVREEMIDELLRMRKRGEGR